MIGAESTNNSSQRIRPDDIQLQLPRGSIELRRQSKAIGKSSDKITSISIAGPAKLDLESHIEQDAGIASPTSADLGPTLLNPEALLPVKRLSVRSVQDELSADEYDDMRLDKGHPIREKAQLKSLASDSQRDSSEKAASNQKTAEFAAQSMSPRESATLSDDNDQEKKDAI